MSRGRLYVAARLAFVDRMLSDRVPLPSRRLSSWISTATASDVATRPRRYALPMRVISAFADKTPSRSRCTCASELGKAGVGGRITGDGLAAPRCQSHWASQIACVSAGAPVYLFVQCKRQLRSISDMNVRRSVQPVSSASNNQLTPLDPLHSRKRQQHKCTAVAVRSSASRL